MAEQHVRAESRDGCAWVTIDRPPLNLFTIDLVEQLAETFRALSATDGVRAAVIRGAGQNFSGGMQIQELSGLSSDAARTLITRLRDAIAAVHNAPFPTVALISGACFGAAFELVLSCDLRVVSEDAWLGLPEVKLGIPSVIQAALLPGIVGPGRAAELLLTGNGIKGRQAHDWGLANRVSEPESLEAETTRLVDEILRCSPGAIRLQKELMIRWRDSNQRTAIDAGVDVFARAYESDEPREAMRAFLHKRSV
jgi:enoyl-CoA hydratase